MKKKGHISAKTAKAIKELDQIPDIRLKIFFKMLLSAKDCGIDVFKKKGSFWTKTNRSLSTPSLSTVHKTRHRFQSAAFIGTSWWNGLAI